MLPRSSIGLTLLFLLLSSNTARGQEYREKIFTVRDGLPANNVQSLFQDHRGFIWITTSNGLARFDGYTFKVFHHDAKDPASLSDSRTTVVTEDHQHRIWIGTYNGGVNCYDPSRLKFTHYFFQSSKINNINSQQVNRLLVDSTGRLWSGNYNGLYYFDQKKNQFIEYPLDSCLAVKDYYNWIINLQYDGRHCLFIVTNHGNAVIDIRTMQSYYAKKNRPGLQILSDTSTGNNIYSQNEIFYWRKMAGSNKIELCQFNYEKNESRVIITTPDEFHYQDYKLESFDDQSLIVARVNQPLLKIDLNTGRIDSVSFSQLSSAIQIWITERAIGEKNVWCAAHDGLHLLSEQRNAFHVTNMKTLGKPYSNFSAADQLFLSRENQLWMASYFTGIAVADSNLNTTHLFIKSEFDSRIYNFIWRIYEDWRGKIWIGRQCGYSVYDPSTKVMKDFFLERHDNTGNNFYVSSSFLQTDDSTIWMGSNKGLAEVNTISGNVHRWYVYDANHPEDFPMHRVNKIVRDSMKNNWLITDDGLFSFDPANRKFKTFNEETGTAVKLPKVMDVVSQSHLLLIGATNGFCVFDVQTKKLKMYSFSDGLPNEQVDYVIPENENVCWLVTSSGLSRFEIRNESFTNFNYKEGLPSFEGEVSNLLRLHDSDFMITADSFLIRFNPYQLNASAIIPPVTITEFVADGKSLPVSEDTSQEINLSWKNRTISIDFSTLQFSDANLAQYQYRLAGVDQSWNNAFIQNRINYSNLSSGKYRFEVRAGYGNGIWGKPTALSVVIENPFWKTTWFWILVSVVLLSIPILILWNIISNQRAKIFQHQRINSERQRISAELHDDVGSTLTKIALLGHAYESDPEKNKNLLSRMTSSADSMVDHMNEIIWALNVRNDTLQNLLAYLRKYASEFLEGKFDLQIKQPELIPEKELSGEARRNIFLVVKEALHNVMKHSNAHCVNLIFSINHELKISIADDGVGISEEKKNEFGNGLVNMKQRMEQIGGTFRIESLNGRGTQILIHYPLT